MAIHYIEVELENRPEPVEIPVNVIGMWESDGIGRTEVWGHKSYSAGSYYYAIVDYKWNKTGFSPEEIRLIDNLIESKFSEWENETSSC